MVNQVNFCGICTKKINEFDNYVRLTDYKSGQFFMEGFYHTKCYNDKISGGKDMSVMKKLAMRSLLRANKLMDQQGA